MDIKCCANTQTANTTTTITITKSSTVTIKNSSRNISNHWANKFFMVVVDKLFLFSASSTGQESVKIVIE